MTTDRGRDHDVDDARALAAAALALLAFGLALGRVVEGEHVVDLCVVAVGAVLFAAVIRHRRRRRREAGPGGRG